MTAVEQKQRTVTGVVVSDAMDKTIVVRVERRVKHPLYSKILRRFSKLHAHDEDNQCRRGDVVAVCASRPVSKKKRWRLVEIKERPELAGEQL